MKLITDMTQGELAAYIQSHLRTKDVEVVLTGGSAVSIYSRGKVDEYKQIEGHLK